MAFLRTDEYLGWDNKTGFPANIYKLTKFENFTSGNGSIMRRKVGMQSKLSN
jgi:hypothetical protein